MPADEILRKTTIRLRLKGCLMNINGPLTIRPERPEDIEAIREVNISAFARPGHLTDEADVVDAIRTHGKVVASLVAETDGLVVGHILFSPLRFQPEQPPLTGVGLGPLAVRPEFQGQGIGSQLIRAGLESCRELGYRSVFLWGNPRYYRRFGFLPASDFGIKPPGQVMNAFQALELAPDALSGVFGTAYEVEELT